MALSRWSPISDLVSLHSAMDRLFSDVTTGRARNDAIEDVSEGYLPLDVYQTDKDWVIRASVPSVDPNQINVTCQGNTIRIEGEIKQPNETRSENYWLRENFYGRFLRQVTLPQSTMCDQSKAEFKNGMLELRVPKKEPSKPEAKKIPVAAAAGSTPSQTQPQGQQGQEAQTSGQGAKDREAQPAGRR